MAGRELKLEMNKTNSKFTIFLPIVRVSSPFPYPPPKILTRFIEVIRSFHPISLSLSLFPFFDRVEQREGEESERD